VTYDDIRNKAGQLLMPRITAFDLWMDLEN
jgi:hypothetical protein